MKGLWTFSLISILYQRRLISLELFDVKVDWRIKVDDNSAKKIFFWKKKKKKKKNLNTNSSRL